MLMAGECERGRVERLLGVALFAAVHVRRACKLAAVNVAVAIEALAELDLEERGTPAWGVALRTIEGGVPAAEWEAGGVVFGERELDVRFETVNGVAAFAAAAVGALGELTVVRIRLVAVGAEIVSDGGLEVGATMALLATYFQVFSQQRVLRFRVVEIGAERVRLFPAGDVVAVFAGLAGKGGAMRIGVAGGAAVELESDIFGRAVLLGCVALGAGNTDVRSPQGELGLAVVEGRARGLPVGCVVALQAVGAELAAMLIFVTRDAVARDAEEGSCEILAGERGPFDGRDVLRVVTLVAGQARVLAVEDEAGFGMVVSVRRRVPLG